MKVSRDGDAIIITCTPKEASHLGRRLNVSSYQTFDDYRKEHGHGGHHRNPLADDLIGQLRENHILV